ncbi:MAG: hypothetical protein HY769_10040 [Candidatus Stahlbacteria bacterium]|nr:hypothetical protein [Candidatus Stahlbacteria bacterium]
MHYNGLKINIVILSVVFSLSLSNAYEYRYPLITRMQILPILTTAEPMKWKEAIAGFTLGTGNSSNPKIEQSAGIFGSLGLISNWISTRWSYSTVGTRGELILCPLKIKATNLSIGAGGVYLNDVINSFYTLYCSHSMGTMTPYATLRYDKYWCEAFIPGGG